MTGVSLSSLGVTGTWIPVDASGSSLVFTNQSGGYTIIGNIAFAYFSITYPVTVDTGSAVIGGLPVPSGALTYDRGYNPIAILAGGTATNTIVGATFSNSTTALLDSVTGASIQNVTLSGAVIRGTLIYALS